VTERDPPASVPEDHALAGLRHLMDDRLPPDGQRRPDAHGCHLVEHRSQRFRQVRQPKPDGEGEQPGNHEQQNGEAAPGQDHRQHIQQQGNNEGQGQRRPQTSPSLTVRRTIGVAGGRRLLSTLRLRGSRRGRPRRGPLAGPRGEPGRRPVHDGEHRNGHESQRCREVGNRRGDDADDQPRHRGDKLAA
jgi:hypothetical protein